MPRQKILNIYVDKQKKSPRECNEPQKLNKKLLGFLL